MIKIVSEEISIPPTAPVSSLPRERWIAPVLGAPGPLTARAFALPQVAPLSPSLCIRETGLSWERSAPHPPTQPCLYSQPLIPSGRCQKKKVNENHWTQRSQNNQVWYFLFLASIPSQYPPQPASEAPSLSKCKVSLKLSELCFRKFSFAPEKLIFLLTYELKLFCITNSCFRAALSWQRLCASWRSQWWVWLKLRFMKYFWFILVLGFFFSHSNLRFFCFFVFVLEMLLKISK